METFQSLLPILVILDIPRVNVGSTGYFALLRYEGNRIFSLVRAGISRKASSIKSLYIFPMLNLPMIKCVKNGKVIKVYRAKLRRRSDGKFYLEQFLVHPCSKYPEVNRVNCYQ